MSLFMTTAKPVTPPGAIVLGPRKYSKLMAIMRTPIVNEIYENMVLYHFLSSDINPLPYFTAFFEKITCNMNLGKAICLFILEGSLINL